MQGHRISTKKVIVREAGRHSNIISMDYTRRCVSSLAIMEVAQCMAIIIDRCSGQDFQVLPHGNVILGQGSINLGVAGGTYMRVQLRKKNIIEYNVCYLEGKSLVKGSLQLKLGNHSTF
jgi:hypothetical protein